MCAWDDKDTVAFGGVHGEHANDLFRIAEGALGDHLCHVLVVDVESDMMRIWHYIVGIQVERGIGLLKYNSKLEIFDTLREFHFDFRILGPVSVVLVTSSTTTLPLTSGHHLVLPAGQLLRDDRLVLRVGEQPEHERMSLLTLRVRDESELLAGLHLQLVGLCGGVADKMLLEGNTCVVVLHFAQHQQSNVFHLVVLVVIVMHVRQDIGSGVHRRGEAKLWVLLPGDVELTVHHDVALAILHRGLTKLLTKGKLTMVSHTGGIHQTTRSLQRNIRVEDHRSGCTGVVVLQVEIGTILDQQFDDAISLCFKGLMQGTFTELVLMIDVCLVFQQNLCRLHRVVLCTDHQRRSVVVINSVQLDILCFAQDSSCCTTIELGSIMKRSETFLILRLDRGTMLQQLRNGISLVLLRSNVQGSHSVREGLVHIGFSFTQQQRERFEQILAQKSL
mmetsp:Transcript_4944/g.15091  ORF Transcript_4944/g.15091 Transcript_4944/m.15091 type:complete len:447 (+) Transcript_4944:153-1493(+)